MYVDSQMASTYTSALAYCKKRRAMLILDPPSSWTDPALVADADIAADLGVTRDENAAVFFPRFYARDLKLDNRLESFAPSGAMAGVFARTDATRGVHKAPANEVVRGAIGLAYQTTKGEQDTLNPNGVNCIRAFPGRGIRVWGARTVSSNPSWRYISVRRLFNYVEESIREGTQWVVFEPNDHFLWARITRDITAFLRLVWRSGALFGTTPETAFYVKCDEELNPPEVRDAGMLIVEIGMAPVKPAEFVIFSSIMVPSRSSAPNMRASCAIFSPSIIQ